MRPHIKLPVAGVLRTATWATCALFVAFSIPAAAGADSARVQSVGDAEPNDAPSLAQGPAVGGLSGNLATQNDSDWYYLYTPPSAGPVQLHINVSNTTPIQGFGDTQGLDVVLWGSSGSEIASTGLLQPGNYADGSIDFSVAPNWRFYIEVVHAVNALEADLTPSAGVTYSINVGGAVTAKPTRALPAPPTGSAPSIGSKRSVEQFSGLLELATLIFPEVAGLEMASTLLDGSLKIWGGDPPDPNYQATVSLVAPTVPAVKASKRLPATVAHTLNSLSRAEAYAAANVRAMISAGQKAQGAEAAGDRGWLTTQGRAASAFARSAASLLTRDRVLRLNLKRVAARTILTAKLKQHNVKKRLSPKTVAAMTRAGYSRSLRNAIAVSTARVKAGTSVVAMLTNKKRLAALSRIVSELKQYAAQLDSEVAWYGG